jgi:hypothetical protein
MHTWRPNIENQLNFLKLRRCLLLAAVVCVAIPDWVRGQASLSTLRGTVTDASGAVVPGAIIHLQEPATGILLTQPADKEGNYELISIKPGVYKLTCESPGFTAFTASDVLLEGGQIRRIDIRLSIGQSTQEVTVTAGAAIINTESGTITGSFDSHQKADSPAVDIYPTPWSLLTTLSGVEGGTSGYIRINGQNTQQQSRSLDGIINDPTGNQSDNPEFFQEVAATTVNAPADSSRVANYVMTSKRGVNEVHGEAYYKFFSSVFNARNPFSATKTPYLQHEWKVEMGWPIIKNRTFIYGTWFSQRIPLGSFATASVPTAAMRAGNFSTFSQTVKDPLTGQPFPGNIIPADRISSVSTQIQNYYPQPATAGLVNNYPFVFPFNSDLYKGDWLMFRLDHNITSKNSVYGRWLMRRTPYVLQNGLPSLLWTRIRNHQQTAIVDTHVFSPSMINTFRFGYNTDYIEDGIPEAGVTPADGSKVLAQSGLQGSNPGNFMGQGFPGMTINGVTPLVGRPGGVMNDNHIYTVDDSVSMRYGRHIMKFGGTYQLNKQFVGAVTNYGAFTFDGSVAGIGYADFLLGIPRQSSRVNPLVNRDERAAELGLFGMDTFRISKNLTIEYGLRWDYFTSPTYDDGLMYTFDLKTASVVVPQAAMAKISPLYPKNLAIRAGNPVPHSDLRNFRPRVSAAYRLPAKMVLRGGYGSYTERIPYSNILAPTYFTLVDGGGPFQIAETYLNVVQPGQNPLFQFPNPYPNNLALASVPSQSVTALPTQVHNGSIHQFNVTVEKELGDMGLRGSYIGSRGRGLNYPLNINIPEPSLIPFTASRRPYPQVVNVTQYRSDGNANYDAFQVEIKRRMGSFMFDAHYVVQRNVLNFLDTENPYDVTSHWANEAGTRQQYFVATSTWNVPVGRGKRFLRNASKSADLIVGNWEIHTISYLGSGLPFSPSFSGSDTSNTGTFGGLPDLVGNSDPAGGRTHQMWFNPAAFAVPSAGRFGNAEPNSLLGMRLSAHHLSIIKKVRITERVTYTLTTMFTNIFNHPMFNAPLSNISAPGAGAFTSVVGLLGASERGFPREIVFKGRFEF